MSIDLRRCGFWSIYIAVLVTSTVALLEGAVRLVGVGPTLPRQFAANVADAFLPWKLEPFSVSEGATPEFTFRYAHNSVGLRDVEHVPRKPEGVFRILVLGDSFTYGVGVAFDETYVARLGRLLNERLTGRPTVEMINAGIPRYWPEPERMFLEHYGLAYEPDIVLVAFVPNDVVDTHVGLQGLTVSQGFLVTRGLDPFGGAGIWLYRHSQVFRILFSRYLSSRDDVTNEAVPAASYAYQADGVFEGDWRTVEGEYDRIAQLASDAGARMVLAFMPAHSPWPPTLHDYPQRRLMAWCQARGVTWIDTAPALTAAAEHERPYYPVDGHPTAAGHAVIADAILDSFMRNGIPPPSRQVN
jgi:lysophospholipase L1-like esterase